MSSMQFHPNELFIIYDPGTNVGKQTRAYAKSIANNINEVDYNKTTLTTTLWKEIVNMLDMEPKKLLDKSKKEYQEKVAGNTFTMEGWLEILMHHPQMLKGPIAIYRNTAVLCATPSDILKLDDKRSTPAKIPPHLRPRE